VTTTSITAVSVSTRSAQSTFKAPEVIQGKTSMRTSWWPKPTCTKAIHDRIIEIIRNVVVMTSVRREPAAAGSW
jgi:hypothetical protein